jgi:hypothetical protein
MEYTPSWFMSFRKFHLGPQSTPASALVFLHPSMEIVNGHDFVDSIRGVGIEDGEIGDDGMHLYLTDGRILIVVGIVYVGELERTIQ